MIIFDSQTIILRVLVSGLLSTATVVGTAFKRNQALVQVSINDSS